jgi:hypothetical protein
MHGDCHTDPAACGIIRLRAIVGALPKLLSLGVVYSVMRHPIISARSVAVAFILALSLVAAMSATAGATTPMGKLTAKQTVAADSEALFGSIAAKPPTPDPRAAAERAEIAATQGNCTALILSREGKLVTLFTRVYKYKFVKIKKGRNKGKFQRKIVRVKVGVRIACSKQCVQVKKKKGKYQSIYTIKKIKVKVKKRGKIVTVKRRARVYKFGSCKNLPSAEELGVPVKVTILPGSYALLDFGSFTRQAPISGTLRGFIPGRFKPNTDIQVTLTKAAISIGTTNVFIDDACNGQVSAAIRTGNPTRVLLDSGKTSTTTLFASGTATAIVYTRIQLPLDLRNEDTGCNDPYVTTGYGEFTQTFFFRGKVGPKGLLALQVSSPPDILSVVACLAPGIPTQPCNGFQVPVPIMVSVKTIVNVDLSGKG